MKMNNKILTFAVGAMLLCAGTLTTSAQKYVDYTKNAQDLVVGDTVVMIDGNPSHYLTGEKIPKWVYQKRHSIMQIGTKRFPNGVLLREIYSWVDLNYMHKPQEVKNEEKTPVVEQVVTVEPEQTDKYVEQTVVPEPQEEVKPEPAEEVGEQPQEVKEEEKQAEEQPAVPAFQRFSIGVRGGAASLMQQAPAVGNWKLGYNAMLDLQYAYYFARTKHPERAARHGILVDLSAGYTNSPLKAELLDDQKAFTKNINGGDFVYDISASNLKEHDGQVQVELALMYSLLYKGFFFNVGPKVILPVYSHFNNSFDNCHIVATSPEGVEIRDAWMTGRFEDNGGKNKWNNSKANLALAADLGYEFKLRNGHALGLGLYADYNFVDFGFKAAEDNGDKLFNIKTYEYQAADVDLLPLTDSYTKKLNGFDCGVKVIYHFNFPKQF